MIPKKNENKNSPKDSERSSQKSNKNANTKRNDADRFEYILKFPRNKNKDTCLIQNFLNENKDDLYKKIYSNLNDPDFSFEDVRALWSKILTSMTTICEQYKNSVYWKQAVNSNIEQLSLDLEQYQKQFTKLGVSMNNYAAKAKKIANQWFGIKEDFIKLVDYNDNSKLDKEVAKQIVETYNNLINLSEDLRKFCNNTRKIIVNNKTIIDENRIAIFNFVNSLERTCILNTENIKDVLCAYINNHTNYKIDKYALPSQLADRLDRDQKLDDEIKKFFFENGRIPYGFMNNPNQPYNGENISVDGKYDKFEDPWSLNPEIIEGEGMGLNQSYSHNTFSCYNNGNTGGERMGLSQSCSDIFNDYNNHFQKKHSTTTGGGSKVSLNLFEDLNPDINSNSKDNLNCSTTTCGGPKVPYGVSNPFQNGNPNINKNNNPSQKQPCSNTFDSYNNNHFQNGNSNINLKAGSESQIFPFQTF